MTLSSLEDSFLMFRSLFCGWRDSGSRGVVRAGMAAVIILLTSVQAGGEPQGSAFTFQGRLNASGSPAAGSYDFRFGLYDGELSSGQIGTTVSLSAVNVDGGLFSVQLDFGAGAFAGGKRWLAVEASPAGAGTWTQLWPRIAVTPAPAAGLALEVAEGSITDAHVAANAGISASKIAGLGSLAFASSVGPEDLGTSVADSLVPSGTFIMTLSPNPPSGYASTGAIMEALSGPGEWIELTGDNVLRYAASAVTVGEKIYVMGGGSSGSALDVNMEYDPASDTWTTKAQLLMPRQGAMVAAVNGKIYVIGGDMNNVLVSETHVYDPATDTWSDGLAPIPTPRGLGAAAVLNGKIHVLGGSTLSERLAVHEVYDPANDTWTTKAPMPTARFCLVAVVVDGLLHCIGGTPGTVFDQEPTAVHEVYDPDTDTWETRTELPVALSGSGAAEIGGRIYLVGGVTDLPRSLAYEYDPSTGRWYSKASSPTDRAYLASTAFNGRLYVFGGLGSNLASLMRTNAFIPSSAPNLLLHVHRKD